MKKEERKVEEKIWKKGGRDCATTPKE